MWHREPSHTPVAHAPLRPWTQPCPPLSLFGTSCLLRGCSGGSLPSALNTHLQRELGGHAETQVPSTARLEMRAEDGLHLPSNACRAGGVRPLQRGCRVLLRVDVGFDWNSGGRLSRAPQPFCSSILV